MREESPVQYWKAEISRSFQRASTGNNFGEVSGIFEENYVQYWLLPVLRPEASAPAKVKKRQHQQGFKNGLPLSILSSEDFRLLLCLGRMPEVSYSPRVRSIHLLETLF